MAFELIKGAWQPLTFGGIARFATAPLKRLLFVQVVVALLVAGAVVWFLNIAWFPTVADAIHELPTTGDLRAGRIDWVDNSPRLLAESHFLAFSADKYHTGRIRSPADLHLEVGDRAIRIWSMFGYADFYWPRTEWIIACNRVELEPWWGAWRPPILWLTFGATIVVLLLVWSVLAAVLTVPAFLLAFYANREVRLAGVWKLCGAALMPGALLMILAIVLYGSSVLDLVGFVVAEILHLVMGFVFALASVWFAPTLKGAKPNPNPFVSGK